MTAWAKEAFEKLDGSLGILYRVDGEPRIASRGSFDSEQALRATAIYRNKYARVKLDDSLTYLFEIIYPANRIVVDYGDTEDLVLLAVIETATGIERPLPDIGLPLVKRYDGLSDFREILEAQGDNREGFVVKFRSGQRVKIKFAEYKRLHKLLTGVSARSIWDILRTGGDVRGVIDRVPDEFHRWVRETENSLRCHYSLIEARARERMQYCGTRKELAEAFKRSPHPDVMFAILDGKNYSDLIWRKVKPSSESVFRS